MIAQWDILNQGSQTVEVTHGGTATQGLKISYYVGVLKSQKTDEAGNRLNGAVFGLFKIKDIAGRPKSTTATETSDRPPQQAQKSEKR